MATLASILNDASNSRKGGDEVWGGYDTRGMVHENMVGHCIENSGCTYELYCIPWERATDRPPILRVFKTGRNGKLKRYDIERGNRAAFIMLLDAFGVRHASWEQALRFTASKNDAEIRDLIPNSPDPVVSVAAQDRSIYRESLCNWEHKDDRADGPKDEDSYWALTDHFDTWARESVVPDNAYGDRFEVGLREVAEQLKKLGLKRDHRRATEVQLRMQSIVQMHETSPGYTVDHGKLQLELAQDILATIDPYIAKLEKQQAKESAEWMIHNFKADIKRRAEDIMDTAPELAIGGDTIAKAQDLLDQLAALFGVELQHDED
jgi:hypothetical protein